MHLLIIIATKSVYEIWNSKKKADDRKKELIGLFKQSPRTFCIVCTKILDCDRSTDYP